MTAGLDRPGPMAVENLETFQSLRSMPVHN